MLRSNRLATSCTHFSGKLPYVFIASCYRVKIIISKGYSTLSSPFFVGSIKIETLPSGAFQKHQYICTKCLLVGKLVLHAFNHSLSWTLSLGPSSEIGSS